VLTYTIIVVNGGGFGEFGEFLSKIIFTGYCTGVMGYLITALPTAEIYC